jgi:glycosyltransferase involved in cell wall biosynthesis
VEALAAPKLSTTALAGKKISAIIACYRDAPAVPQMHERLTAVFQKLGVGYEIIFVNDSSPDDAQEVLAELAARDPHVTVVTHARNFGSQSAFTSGMRIATGDAVVLLDGDLQDPPELIEDFAVQWLAGYEVIYGRRIKRETTRTMQILYKLFYRVFRSMSYIRVPLDAGDFSLLDRRVVDALNSLPESNRFLRGLRAWVRRVSPTSGRSGRSERRRTRCSETWAGRERRSSPSRTRRSTSSPGSPSRRWV